MSKQKTTTIDAESATVTLINVYEVAPERQAELTRLLADTKYASGSSVSDHQYFHPFPAAAARSAAVMHLRQEPLRTTIEPHSVQAGESAVSKTTGA